MAQDSIGSDDLAAEWSRICRRLDAAGQKALANHGVETGRERAEALRLMVREFRGAAERFLEASDGAFPHIFRIDETSSGPLSAPNIDNWYLHIPLDAAFTYRFTSNLHQVFDVIFAPHDDAYANMGELYGKDIKTAPNGDYEVILGGPPREFNWMPLQAGTTFITIRLYFYDWDRETPPPISIERLGSAGEAPEPITPPAVIRGLDRAIDMLELNPYKFAQINLNWVKDLPVNTICPPQHIGVSSQIIQYGTGVVSIGPDEALIVETDVPHARYWGFHIYTYPWFELIDVSNRVTALNGLQVHADDDGKVRLVLAHRDPGVQNWLDLAGERQVLFFYRWAWSSDSPTPVARKVALADVRKELPASTPAFDRDARARQIEARRRHLARRFRY